MNTFDLLDIASTGTERRREEELWNAINRGDVREIAKQLQPEREYGLCDVCHERPGDRVRQPGGHSLCDECTDAEHARMLGRKVIKFRSRDERDAYEAGSRTRGEI